jgi:hypothetical protein
LKGLRPTVCPQRERLTVENHRPRRQPPHDIDDLRHRRRHVTQRPREYADLVVGLVHLDAGAIELVFERGFAEHGEGFVHVGGRIGEHRLNRLEQRDDKCVECGRPCGQRRPRHLRQPTGHHRRAPDESGGDPRRPCDGFHQHPFKRTLTQLAEQQSNNEVLLVGRALGEQMPEHPGLRGRRSRTGDAGNPAKRFVDVAQPEGRL